MGPEQGRVQSRSLCAATVLGARRARPWPACLRHRAGPACGHHPPVVLAFLPTSLYVKTLLASLSLRPLPVAGGGGLGPRLTSLPIVESTTECQAADADPRLGVSPLLSARPLKAPALFSRRLKASVLFVGVWDAT